MWDPSAKLFLLILLKLYCSRRFHRPSTWIRGEICFIERFHSRGWASAQIFFFVEQRKAFTQGYFQRSCLVDEIRHIHNALIITFRRRQRGYYYGFAPCLSRSPPHCTSFGWFVFFSLPVSSHPTWSRVCIFHPEKAVSFSQPYLGEWVGSV